MFVYLQQVHFLDKLLQLSPIFANFCCLIAMSCCIEYSLRIFLLQKLQILREIAPLLQVGKNTYIILFCGVCNHIVFF